MHAKTKSEQGLENDEVLLETSLWFAYCRGARELMCDASEEENDR